MRNSVALWTGLLPFLVQASFGRSLSETHARVRASKVEREASTEQMEVKSYKLWDPALFQETLMIWRDQYPDLIRVTTSQEKYNLPTAGTKDDCPFYEEDKGCPNYIFEIQDFVANPEDSYSSNHLPEVFWSGCLHGNERVGPTSVMEAASLLLEAASCEALPRYNARKVTTNDPATKDYGTLEEQKVEARSCRQALKEKGIDDVHRKWLARLVTTRRLVVVPTANALGYYRNRREEGAVDPNRDFPYDLEDYSKCMQTIAGRTLNEVYRDHLFQLAFTFHAGMEVVSYEWGAPSWMGYLSPDHTAETAIASAYSRFGGGWSKSQPYDYGDMNDKVYYVRGGMEDWAYAASWDTERVQPCQPNTFGGYPGEKTTYNNSTLRVFNMLVETSDNKEPRASNLGSSLDILNKDTPENGHVSRNIRLALLALDLVEPYVSIVGVNSVAVHDDEVPLSQRGDRVCKKQKSYSVAKDLKQVEFEFTVGGAMTIDDIDIWFARWRDIPSDQLDCISQPKTANGFSKGTIVGARNGTGFFSDEGSYPLPSESSESNTMTNGPIFKGRIEIPPGMKALDELVVMASARVDQDWTVIPSKARPKSGPQSHVVNARTNADWHHESADKHIVGRLDWFSSPVTIVIGDFVEGVGTHGGDGLVDTVEMYPRFQGHVATSGLKPKAATDDQLWFPVSMWYTFAIILLVAVACLCCSSMQRKRTHEKIAEQYDQDDGFTFGLRPYSDIHADGSLEEEDLNDGVELPQMP